MNNKDPIKITEQEKKHYNLNHGFEINDKIWDMSKIIGNMIFDYPEKFNNEELLHALSISCARILFTASHKWDSDVREIYKKEFVRNFNISFENYELTEELK